MPRVSQWRDLRAEAFFARDDPAPLVAELSAVVRSRRARGAVLEAKRSLLRLDRPPAFALNLVLALSSEAALRRSGHARPRQGPLPGDRVLVLAPHPDDETIMCGASIAASRRRGDTVRIVALTSGAATTQQGGLDDVAAARRSELRRAAAALGVVDVVFWDLPDRGLTAARDRLAELLAAELDEFAPSDVYVPFPFDSHADHVAGAMALADALATGRHGEPTVHCGFVSDRAARRLDQSRRGCQPRPTGTRSCAPSPRTPRAMSRSSSSRSSWRGSLRATCCAPPSSSSSSRRRDS